MMENVVKVSMYVILSSSLVIRDAFSQYLFNRK